MESLFRLLDLIALDNDLQLKPLTEICWPPGYDWHKLNEDAKKLSLEQAEIFCCGDETEILQLIENLDLGDLHDLLDSAFDGELYTVFYDC